MRKNTKTQTRSAGFTPAELKELQQALKEREARRGSSAKWLAKNREAALEAKRNWRELNPDYWKLRRARHRDLITRFEAQQNGGAA